MHYLISILISIIIIMSIWQFITYKLQRENKRGIFRTGISFELFYTLMIIYGIVIIGFGLLYFLLSYSGQILVEIGQVPVNTAKAALYRSFYFSGVTMLTIGYGDIIPVGIGRLLAIVQALIGYILPTAFVLKLVHVSVETPYLHPNEKNKEL